MPTPKLYLIVSEDDKGKIKIGTTAANMEHGAVYARISKYATGISDNSVVYEILGARVFEQYLHSFLADKNKVVEVRFDKGWPIIRPQEWFLLPPHVLEILVEAFVQEHPKRLDEIDVEALPLFLSGVFSAIRWHAGNLSAEEIAEMRGQEELEGLQENALDGAREERITPFFEPRALQVPERERVQTAEYEDLEGIISKDQEQILSIFRRERWLERELKAIKEIETTRTLMALCAVLFQLLLLSTGATKAGHLFAILSIGLVGAWPFLEPGCVARVGRLSQRLQHYTDRVRQRATTDGR